MSEDVCLLEKMKDQLIMYSAQKEQAQVNFQQLCGAIYALETMIKNAEEGKCMPQVPCAQPGDTQDGQVDDQSTEQATQE